VWRIPNNMFQYSPWTLTNTGAVGGSLLYCYYTEMPCNKKKAFVHPLKLLQWFHVRKMSKDDGRHIFFVGSKIPRWNTHKF
jgi:hypothetical protein